MDVDQLADALAERLRADLVVPQLLSVRRVAEMLDVSERQARGLIADGKLVSIKVEGSRRVDVAAVRDYLARAQATNEGQAHR